MSGHRRDALIRLARYAIVGMAANGALYLGYIALTAIRIPPEAASALLFVVGVTATYIVNRGWSFKSRENHGWAAPRYAATYLFGFGIQIGVLAAAYRMFDVPHLIAQLFAMACAAATIFLLLNFWVFGRDRQS